MSDDVLTLTGQRPLSVQEFVRKNAATFTASARGLVSRVLPVQIIALLISWRF
jgi:hypothetical protein